MIERDVECETLIRWDRTDEPASFWTADAHEARRWTRLGYSVEVDGSRDGKPSSWRCRVPPEAVALLPMTGGQVRASRYLEPPTLSDRRVKAAGATKRRKDAQIPAEKRAVFPAAETNAAG